MQRWRQPNPRATRIWGEDERHLRHHDARGFSASFECRGRQLIRGPAARSGKPRGLGCQAATRRMLVVSAWHSLPPRRCVDCL